MLQLQLKTNNSLQNSMGNILKAIQAIVNNPSIAVEMSSESESQNRANQMGDALEDYVKDAFADCIGQDTEKKNHARAEAFSYLGNSSNPPDAMLKGSDAIEIKKITSIATTQLQLNSSYPKNKLYSDNPKISNECRNCEEWEERAMLYVVGQVDNTELRNIFFVYGDLYCDSREVYENVENAIKDGLTDRGLELEDTNELGRVNKVDHLNISRLRIRGMWLIDSPYKHFAYLTEKENQEYTFRLIALIPKEKYTSFDNIKDFEDFCKKNNVSINDKEIKDPKNPARLISSKLIVYYK